MIENWIHWKALSIETVTKIKSISHLRGYTLVDSICRWSCDPVFFDSASSGTEMWKTTISFPFFCACLWCVSKSWSLTGLACVIFDSICPMTKCQCSHYRFQGLVHFEKEWERRILSIVYSLVIGPVQVTGQATNKGAILVINLKKIIKIKIDDQMVVLRYLNLRSTLQTWLCTSELRLTVVRDYPDGWLLMLLGSRGMPYWYPITLGASSQRMPFKVELPIDFVTANMDSHYILMAEFNCVGSICILAHEKL